MFPLNLEILLPLTGILFGITFGLLGGISREEKIKYIIISVFGTITTTFCGAGFIVYGYSKLEVLLWFIFWSCLGFSSAFLVGLAYRKRKNRIQVSTGLSPFYHPSPRERREIERNTPKVKAELETTGNLLFGYKIEISLRMQNISEEILDKLYASLKISDLSLKKKERSVFKRLPNLIPKEEREYKISEKIGRSGNYAVDLRILRSKVPLWEFHWDIGERG
jgi:hypothetical protein